MSHTEGQRRAGPGLGVALGCLAVIVLAGCGMPRDPEKTLAHVQGRALRVGITANAPWADLKGADPGGRPAGIEPELVERFAKELQAEVVWVRGSETQLLTELENFKLDLVIAGLKDDTLWKDRVGLSRTYAKTADGKHVLATPPGENGFLLRLDKFLAAQEDVIRKRVEAEGATATRAEEVGSRKASVPSTSRRTRSGTLRMPAGSPGGPSRTSPASS